MKTPHFYVINIAATLISTIPVSICFLKQIKTIPYTMKMMPNEIVSAKLSIMRPIIAKPKKTAKVNPIKK